jgi:pyruvate-formate lyase-activating enzyme
MEKLLELVAKFESVKEFVNGQQSIIDGRVAEAVVAAKAGIQAELEAAYAGKAEAEAKVSELMAGVDAALTELKADADEVAEAVTVKTPAEAEPVVEPVVEAPVEPVVEPVKEGE